MIGLDDNKLASNRQQRLSFLTYFLTGSGILVTVMFMSAAVYLATIN